MININLQAKIAVLLSTYNGEKYLDLQIQSILAQSHSNFQLIIRDDASTDGTLKILKKWGAIDKRISVVEGKKILVLH
ncbi:glycosyltransferase [Polynucleobacter paneuropaeus]|uniref:glycosyltransferase n=1 Tax=Polynucleobacter paneuropaeus TaxID=2527775 RepID=UPI000DBF0D90|nr:glycosyltransferase [Polynucleobacter paneuropaeus]AWW44054.1 hypothetical protein DPM16_01705 [Polynucleobacter paneuropaeus]